MKASKCGVVCSSSKIITSMLLEIVGFLGVKKKLVEDVVSLTCHFSRWITRVPPNESPTAAAVFSGICS